MHTALLVFSLAIAPQEGTEKDREAIAMLLDGLRDSIGNAEFTEIAGHFDVKRTLEELRKLGLFGPNTELGGVGPLGLRIALTTGFAANARALAWSRHEIRSVRFLEDGSDAELIVKHWDDDQIVSYRRWWVSKEGDAWRVYDFEDLDLCIRVSTAVATAAGAPRAARQELLQAFRILHQIGQSAAEEDWDGVRDLLDQMPAVELPPVFEAVRWILEGSTHLAAAEYDEVLESCTRAESFRADLPLLSYLRATAFNALGRHQEALAAARRYNELLGPDENAYAEIGGALRALGRPEEAVEAHGKGLAENPNSVDNLIGLALALPMRKKSAIAAHFKRIDDAPAYVDTIAGELLDAGDLDAVLALVEALREIAPEDANVQYYEASVLLERKTELARAAELIRSAFPRAPAEEKEYYYGLYIEAMTEQGKHLEAYEGLPDRAYAFDAVAGVLEEAGDFDALRKLLEVHRKNAPDDPRIFYWSASAAYGLGDHEETVRILLAHEKEFLTDEENVVDFETMLIRSLVQLGRFEEALAAAKRSTARDDDPYFEVLVYAVMGRAREAVRALETCLDRGLYDLSTFYEDDLMGSRLQRMSFEALRRSVRSRKF